MVVDRRRDCDGLETCVEMQAAVCCGRGRDLSAFETTLNLSSAASQGW